jgi:outer membrane biosynthesis protein TonB
MSKLTESAKAIASATLVKRGSLSELLGVDAKPAPKAAPKAKAKAEPKPAPKPEAKPAPKPEAKAKKSPEPKVKPKPRLLYTIRLEPDLIDQLKKLGVKRGVTHAEVARGFIATSLKGLKE